MPTRTELQKLSELRIDEAKLLHEAKFHAGAYYLAGYSLELALKACVCRALNIQSYPESELSGKFKTHKWEELVLLAGLREERIRLCLDKDFNANWSIAVVCTPEDRYQMARSAEDTSTLLDALLTERKGVLAWLSSRW